MDSAQAFLLLVVVPIVAWAVALLILRGAYQDAQRDWLSRGQTPPFSRIVVASVYGAVPVLFGLSLWFLSADFADALNGATSPGAVDANGMFLWTCVMSAVAGCCTVAGQTLVLRGRLSSYLGSDYGRVLPLSVIPFTAAVFAVVLGILTFGYLGDMARGNPPAPTSAVEAVVTALQAYAVACLAVPVTAVVSNRVRDLGTRGFTRALLISDVGELPLILGLVMGFLAVGGLSPP